MKLIFMYLIIIVIITLILEVILNLSWNSFYFRHGILLFQNKYNIKQTYFKFPDIKILNAKFDESSNNIGHIFGQIGTNDIGVRVKVGEIFRFPLRGFIPVLHGYIQYDPNKKELTLKCLSDWTVTIFLISIGAFNLPFIANEIRNIDAYGSLLINLLFFMFIAFCIIIIPFAIAIYQISQFKKVVKYLLDDGN